MDLFELKKEQLKLAPKVELKDNLSNIKTVGGIDCVATANKILASIVICELPSMKIMEKHTYLLDNPLPYRPGFQAYREMPAMIEAYNKLENEPDILLVSGTGILHPRRLGLASHLGLALNQATIGVTQKILIGRVENAKVFIDTDVCGFEVKTREYSNPVYVSPGHLVSLGMVLNLMPKLIQFPHKMPEPLHIAHKIGRKRVRSSMGEKEIK